jgi:hypothetical protein
VTNGFGDKSSGVNYQLIVKVELDVVPVQFVYVRVNVFATSSSISAPPRFTFPNAANNTVFVVVETQQHRRRDQQHPPNSCNRKVR